MNLKVASCLLVLASLELIYAAPYYDGDRDKDWKDHGYDNKYKTDLGYDNHKYDRDGGNSWNHYPEHYDKKKEEYKKPYEDEYYPNAENKGDRKDYEEHKNENEQPYDNERKKYETNEIPKKYRNDDDKKKYEHGKQWKKPEKHRKYHHRKLGKHESFHFASSVQYTFPVRWNQMNERRLMGGIANGLTRLINVPSSKQTGQSSQPLPLGNRKPGQSVSENGYVIVSEYS